MAKRFTVHNQIKESSLIDEINDIKREWATAEEGFKERIKAVKDRCAHKWDDGECATYEVRYSYGNYGYECEICHRRIK